MMNMFENAELAQAVAALCGVLWAAIRASEWYASIHEARAGGMIRRIEDIAEGAVTATYHEYVEAIKRTPGGPAKLTHEQARNARSRARAAAIHSARQAGIDIMKVIGEDGINVAIEYAVKRQKGR